MITFFVLAIWGDMMLTNNNGEFGYPEQGIYVWSEILPILGTWTIIILCLFELPVICYQYVRNKAKRLNPSHKIV
jgi:hypothetical protein